MKIVVDQSAAVPLRPVLLLPTYEPVEHVLLLAVVPLNEARVLRWLRWCDEWDGVARAEPSARSLTFADDAVRVSDTSAWRVSDEIGTGDRDVSLIADSRHLDFDGENARIVYDAEVEIGRDHIRWGLELKGAPYRIATTEVSRAQLLGYLCRVCSDADVPARFMELMRLSPATALDLVEHGARLHGEPVEGGRHFPHLLAKSDLLPALESVDLELRTRATVLLGKLRHGRNSACRRELGPAPKGCRRV